MSKRVILTAAFATVPIATYLAIKLGASSGLLLSIFSALAVAVMTWTWPGWTK